MKKVITLLAMMMAVAMGYCGVASAQSEPLNVGMKVGYSMPASGDFDSDVVVGVDAQFAMSDNRVFMVEYDYGASADFSETYSSNLSQTGTARYNLVSMSVIQFPDDPDKAGLYYGVGVAYVTHSYIAGSSRL